MVSAGQDRAYLGPTAAFSSAGRGAARSADDVDVGAGADRPCALVRARRRCNRTGVGGGDARRPGWCNEAGYANGARLSLLRAQRRHRRDRYKSSNCYAPPRLARRGVSGRLSYAMYLCTGLAGVDARYSWWDLIWLAPLFALSC